MNILYLKIGTVDTIKKITNLVSVIKEQKYFFDSGRIHRGYYMPARGYEFYLRVVNLIYIAHE